MTSSNLVGCWTGRSAALASRICNFTCNFLAASTVCARANRFIALAGFMRTAMRRAGNDLVEQLELFLRESLRHQRGEAGDIPPGRARLATRPNPTGSATIAKTMGI